MKIILIFFLLFISRISAQGAGISFTSPLIGTIYTAGNTMIISWTLVNVGTTTIPSIDLYAGSSTSLQLVANIATNVGAASLQYSWLIPTTIPTGTNYAISAGTSPNLSYSAFFTIEAAVSVLTTVALVSSSIPAIAIPSSTSIILSSVISSSAITSSLLPSSTTSSFILPSSSVDAQPTIIVSSTSTKPSLSIGAIVGIAVGSAVVGIIIGVGMFIFYRKNNSTNKETDNFPSIMNDPDKHYNTYV